MQSANARRRLHAAPWLLPVALLLACCASSASAATKTVTDKDKGAQISLKTGDTLEVRLEANPTTGYMWYLEPQSTPILKLTGQTQTEPPQNGMVGQPVFQIFKFQPRSSGSGVLLMHYVRSWEKPKPDDKQFDLHVTIE
jgi:inhibitor of cysteine peptidase